MRILTLVTAGFRRPDRETLRRLELEGQHPRTLLYEEVLNSDNLDEQFLARVPLFRRILYKPLPIFVRQLVEAFLLRHRYDAILSWSEKLGMLFALILKVTGSRVPHIALFSWISTPKKARLLKFVHSHIDKLILCSSYQWEFAARTIGIPTSRLVLSRWSVDEKFFRPIESERDMICAVGLEGRDYTTLIEALRGLDIRCHIAAGTGRHVKGENPIDSAAKNLPPNVTIGRRGYKELRDLYARSRLVVVPIRSESDTDHGTTTILEAMAMARPVVCSKVKAQRDVVRDGITGVLVPPGNPDALRETIVQIWNNPELASKMGAAGRAQVEAYHTLEGFLSGIRCVVEEVAGLRPEVLLDSVGRSGLVV